MKANPVSLKLVFGLLLLFALGWLAYINVEFYEETEESSWSVEALRNPYLAAEHFMQSSGIEVTDVDGLARLDSLGNVGTLFFSDANQVQAPRQLRQILDWLEGGGNVIYAANSTAHDDDLLLQTFEVEVDWADTDNDDEDEERSFSETMREFNRQLEQGKSRDEIARALSESQVSLTRVIFADDVGELEIAFANDRILMHPYITDADYAAGEHQPFSWSVSDYGVQMLQFEVGSGLLTIVSDPKIWTSYQIDQHDHAYLLWLLSSQQGDFAVLRSVVRDSIWSLLKKHAGELLLAGGLLVLLWIWAEGQRFGRLAPRDESRTRALGEHFSSVSHYLWHRRHGAYLISPLRQQVLRRASLTLADFAGAESSRQYELLAEYCDLTASAIAKAFDEDEFSEASFVQTVRLLKRIEQSL